MAKTTKKLSKSAQIREALNATPDKAVAEIAKDVGATVGLVYNVKASMKKAGKKEGPKSGSKVRTKSAAPQVAHDALDAAFDFIQKAGGMLNAEKLIAKLKSLRDGL